MEFAIVIVIVAIVGGLFALSRAAAKRLADARAAYDDSLVALKQNPTDPDLKQDTLALGRAYSNLTRQQKGVTVYDEVALSNDIAAACAAATRHVAPTSRGSAEARIAQLNDLRKKGLVTDEEFQLQRTRILQDI